MIITLVAPTKTHFAFVEHGDESNPDDEWSATLCGLEYTESPLTNDKNRVTCKNCLKQIKKGATEIIPHF